MMHQLAATTRNDVQVVPGRSRTPRLPLVPLQTSTAPSSSAILPAKAACACGGGCSTCMEATSRTVQTKLHVSAPGDQLDQEADRVAELVMRMPENEADLARSEPPELPAASLSLSKHPQSVEGGATISDTLASQLDATRGNGNSMQSSVRGFMERRFGADFSAVRIHTGDYAVQMSRELGAQAFTVGNDIYFDAGRYLPEQQSGRQLLAHELTHTLQRKGAGARVLRSCTTNPPAANEHPLITDGTLRSFSDEAGAESFISHHPELYLVCHRIERRGVITFVIYQRGSATATPGRPTTGGPTPPRQPAHVERRIVVTLHPLGAEVTGVTATPRRIRILSSGRRDHPTHLTTGSRINFRDQEHRSSEYGRCYDNPPVSMVHSGRASCPDGMYVGLVLPDGTRDTQNGRCFARHRTVTDSRGHRHQETVHSRGVGDGRCHGGEEYIGAPMRYFQQYFTGGEGFHVGDASASHGCLHLSESDARWLWNNMRMGDIVEVRARPPQTSTGSRHH